MGTSFSLDKWTSYVVNQSLRRTSWVHAQRLERDENGEKISLCSPEHFMQTSMIYHRKACLREERIGHFVCDLPLYSYTRNISCYSDLTVQAKSQILWRFITLLKMTYQKHMSITPLDAVILILGLDGCSVDMRSMEKKQYWAPITTHLIPTYVSRGC